MDPRADSKTTIAAKACQIAPVGWLLGEVQRGKSSIVRTLIGSSEAEIRCGFLVCNKTSRVFDFSSEAPIIHFLDTRGLGEFSYDPTDDSAFCESRVHLILAVVKALDAERQIARDTIRAARRRHPEWRLVVALTCPARPAACAAHYIRADAEPYRDQPAGAHPGVLARPVSAPSRLAGHEFRSHRLHAPGDGLDPPEYGYEALISALKLHPSHGGYAYV